MNRNLLTGILPILLITAVSGQNYSWEAGMKGFFDNREYSNPYDRAQTMFGNRFYAVGTFASENFKLEAGFDLLHEFGDKIEGRNIKPVIYMNYNNRCFNFSFGSFPQRQIQTLPKVLRSDTTNYYRPNIEGALVGIKMPWGFHDIWIDWDSRQEADIREIFQIGGTGQLHFGVFFYRHHFIMTHCANPGIRLPDSHIRDNGGLVSSIGVNLSGFLFDSLTISTGYTMSYDRIRQIYDLTYQNGSLTQLYIELFGFGIRETVYAGEGQQQMWGDRLYQAKFYNRMDLIWYFFRKRNISGSVEFALHQVENTLDVSQLLKISITTGGDIRRRTLPQ